MIKTLPGVGEYTARAIACFAFDEQVALVDTNIRKVISLQFFQGKIPSAQILPREDYKTVSATRTS